MVLCPSLHNVKADKCQADNVLQWSSSVEEMLKNFKIGAHFLTVTPPTLNHRCQK